MQHVNCWSCVKLITYQGNCGSSPPLDCSLILCCVGFRFIHISVVCAREDPREKYHDTKYQAEQLLIRAHEAGIIFMS